jgi:hypothetical protein
MLKQLTVEVGREEDTLRGRVCMMGRAAERQEREVEEAGAKMIWLLMRSFSVMVVSLRLRQGYWRRTGTPVLTLYVASQLQAAHACSHPTCCWYSPRFWPTIHAMETCKAA